MGAVTESLAAVPEVDAGVLSDGERFRREVVEHCRPVIIRGAFSEWPAVRAARISPEALRTYLGRFANARRAEAFVGDQSIGGRYSYAEGLDGFNFDRVEIDLPGALDRILASAAQPGSPTVYIGSLETDIYLPGFSGENRVAVLPSSVSPRIWIGNASIVSCHNDTFDNIACVIAGRRRFTLYPPDAIGDLYIGPIDYTMSGRPISLAAGADPDDPRYPRFAAAAARRIVADLLPGDALYLPKLWWHQVEATEPFNILVNYWWDASSIGPDAPYTTMLLAMIAIADRPAAERAAWQSLFNHYVFRPEGHPLAHLPEDRHGILGPLRSGNYGRIRALVMQLLRGG
ncbi:cupin-like domain-containing protein [Sphingomonas oligophenolica]|uniref:Cupin-like domain-containing protein n=1 Tax=Sphingomonas oligophenolica TaxID=301154 RepID=A0ABU9Y070_9SPHN